MILSASGMCEAGRVLHHLRNNIENPRNTVLITGFQAEQTLGRKIAERQPEVPIFGEPMRLRAEVFKLDELSGHADREDPAIALLFSASTLVLEAWAGLVVILLARRRGIGLRALGFRAPVSWSLLPTAHHS